MPWTKRDIAMTTLLRDIVRETPPKMRHVFGRGDMEATNEVELLVTIEQRNMLVRALNCLIATNSKK